MVHMDLGTTGAKRQSWRKDNPRELLKRLVEENPQADNEELFHKFRVALAKGSDELNESVERYYFDNNIRSLMEKPLVTKQKREQMEREREKIAERIEKKIEEKIDEAATRKLLDAIMPNEKPLRDCTGSECKQMGGWLSGIGEKLGADQVVADKFSEEQIQSHWNRKVRP
jgi:type I site-specific restriction endonuclease